MKRIVLINQGASYLMIDIVNAYAERCDNLLHEFLQDQERFEKLVHGFVKG